MFKHVFLVFKGANEGGNQILPGQHCQNLCVVRLLEPYLRKFCNNPRKKSNLASIIKTCLKFTKYSDEVQFLSACQEYTPASRSLQPPEKECQHTTLYSGTPAPTLI